MRYLIAAALVVSPLMLSAQTAQSAKNPQLATVQPNAAAGRMLSSAAAADRTLAIPAKVRVSTGVVEPQLLHTVDIRPDVVSATAGGRQRTAEVAMIVDVDGRPTALKIVQSAGPDLDPSILEAVSQYRFRPATVSGLKVPVELNLHMNIITGY